MLPSVVSPTGRRHQPPPPPNDQTLTAADHGASPVHVVSSTTFLRALCSFVSHNRASLGDGTSRLTLTPSALTVLHARREELRERLSDREAVKAGRVKEIRGISVEEMNKMFIVLSSLRHLHIESSRQELQLDRQHRFLQVGRDSPPVEAAVSPSPPADAGTVDEPPHSPPFSSRQSSADFTTPRKPDSVDFSSESGGGALRFHIADEDLQDSSAATSRQTSLTSTPHHQHNRSSMELHMNDITLHAAGALNLATYTAAASDSSAVAASPFVTGESPRALYTLDFSLFPSLVRLELRSLPTACACVRLLHLDRLKFQLEMLTVRDCWLAQPQHLLAWTPEPDPPDEEQDAGSALPPAEPPAPLPWDALRFVSLRSSLSSLDASLELLTGVEILDLSGNGLEEVPAHFAAATRLQHLDLGFNQLRTLPNQMHTVVGNLQTLVLRNNKLSSVGLALTCCYSLEKLDLSYNLLDSAADLLVALSSLVNLEHLWLAGNPLAFAREYRVVALAALWRNRLASLERENRARWETAVRAASSAGRAPPSPEDPQVGLEWFYLDDLAAARPELRLAREMADLADRASERARHTANPLLAESAARLAAAAAPSPAPTMSEQERAERARLAANAMLAPPTSSPSASPMPSPARSDASSVAHSAHTLTSPSSSHSSTASSAAGVVPASARVQSQTMLLSKWVGAANEKLHRKRATSHSSASSPSVAAPSSHAGRTPKSAHKTRARIAQIGEEDEGGAPHSDVTSFQLTAENLNAAAAATSSNLTLGAVDEHAPGVSSSAAPTPNVDDTDPVSALRRKLDLSDFLSTLSVIQRESGSHWLSIYQEYQAQRHKAAAEAESHELADEDAASTTSNGHTMTHAAQRAARRRRLASIDATASFSSRRVREEAAERVRAHERHGHGGSGGGSAVVGALSPDASTATTSRSHSPISTSSSRTSPFLRPSSSLASAPAPNVCAALVAEWRDLVAGLSSDGCGTSPLALVDDEAAELEDLLAQQDCLVDRIDAPNEDEQREDDALSATAQSLSPSPSPSPLPVHRRHASSAGSRLLRFRHDAVEDLDASTLVPTPGASAHVLVHAVLVGRVVTAFVANMSTIAPTSAEAASSAPGSPESNSSAAYPSHLFAVHQLSGVAHYRCESRLEAAELYEQLARHLDPAVAASAALAAATAAAATSSSSTTTNGIPSRVRDLDREIAQAAERTNVLRRRRRDSFDEGEEESPSEAPSRTPTPPINQRFTIMLLAPATLTAAQRAAAPCAQFVPIPRTAFRDPTAPVITISSPSANDARLQTPRKPPLTVPMLSPAPSHHQRVHSMPASPVFGGHGGRSSPFSFAHALDVAAGAGLGQVSPSPTALTLTGAANHDALRPNSPFINANKSSAAEPTPPRRSLLSSALAAVTSSTSASAASSSSSSGAARGLPKSATFSVQSSSSPASTSSDAVGDTVVRYYRELLTGERDAARDGGVRAYFHIALLQHPQSKWDRVPPMTPASTVHASEHQSEDIISSTPRSASALLTPRAVFGAGATTPTAISSAAPTPPLVQVSPASPTSPPLQPFYTDASLVLTTTHVLFVASTESRAQVEFRINQARQRQAIANLQGLESRAIEQQTETTNHSDESPPLPSPRAHHEPLSSSLPPPRSMVPAASSSLPKASPAKKVVNAHRALHKTYSTLLSASTPKHAPPPMPLPMPAMAPGAHGPTKPLAVPRRTGSPRRAVGHVMGSSPAAVYGSEGESTASSESDTESDEARIQAPRVGRDRSARSPRVSHLPRGSTLSSQLGAAPQLAPVPAPDEEDVDWVPPASASLHIGSGPGVGRGGGTSLPSARHAPANEQPGLVAMLHQLESHGGTTSTGSARTRTGRSPSPLRTALRRARELFRRRRVESGGTGGGGSRARKAESVAAEEDLYQDVDREYGGYTSDAHIAHEDAADAEDSDSGHGLSPSTVPHEEASDAMDLDFPPLGVDPEEGHALDDPLRYTASNVPLLVVHSESFVNLARVVLGLGLQYLRLEFFSGSALIILTASKHLTSSVVVALQTAYAAHTRARLVIENEDLACLQRVQMHVFDDDADDNLRAYEVVKLLAIDAQTAATAASTNAAGTTNAFPAAHASHGVSAFFQQLTSSASLTAPAPVGAVSRVCLPGVLTLVVLNDGHLFLVEELHLFHHCVEASWSARARDSARRKNAPLQNLLKRWHAAQREDAKTRGKNTRARPDATSANKSKSGAPLRRYRILAVESISQLSHLTRASTLSEHIASLGTSYSHPFSSRLTLSFGARTSAFHRPAVVDAAREWTFECSDTTVQRMQAQLRVQMQHR